MEDWRTVRMEDCHGGGQLGWRTVIVERAVKV